MFSHHHKVVSFCISGFMSGLISCLFIMIMSLDKCISIGSEASSGNQNDEEPITSSNQIEEGGRQIEG